VTNARKDSTPISRPGSSIEMMVVSTVDDSIKARRNELSPPVTSIDVLEHLEVLINDGSIGSK